MKRFQDFLKSLTPQVKEFQQSLYLFSRNRLQLISLIVVLILVLIAIFAPIIAPYPQYIMDETNPKDKLMPPSSTYWFGTDELGRDLFSRVLYGTRISLQTAIVAVAVSLLIGVPLGAIAGTVGGMVDEVIMRVTDIFLSFPPLLLAIAISAFLGPTLENAIVAIAISWWPWYTRLIRGQAVSIRERQFVRAARAIGTPMSQIIFKHILPNTLAPVIVQASMDLGGVILTIASLSFLGLGAQPPLPEWGLLISTSRTYFLNAWWYSTFPGLAIFITVLVFNLIGDGIREVLDPRTRKI